MDKISLELLRLCDEILEFARPIKERIEEAKARGDKETVARLGEQHHLKTLKSGGSAKQNKLGSLKTKIVLAAKRTGKGKRCGAQTRSGHPCMIKVKSGQEKCWRHQGGGAGNMEEKKNKIGENYSGGHEERVKRFKRIKGNEGYTDEEAVNEIHKNIEEGEKQIAALNRQKAMILKEKPSDKTVSEDRQGWKDNIYKQAAREIHDTFVSAERETKSYYEANQRYKEAQKRMKDLDESYKYNDGEFSDKEYEKHVTARLDKKQADEQKRRKDKAEYDQLMKNKKDREEKAKKKKDAEDKEAIDIDHKTRDKNAVGPDLGFNVSDISKAIDDFVNLKTAKW